MTNEERYQWLKERQSGLGSSDAANILGVGFEDAIEVYRSKTTPPDSEPPRRGPLARGIACEQLVAERYEEEMGEQLFPGPRMVRYSSERSWQFCNPDRVREDGRMIELKAIAGFGQKWGPSGTDLVPDGYAVQCQKQMGILRHDSMDLAALDVISWELRIYRVAFSPAFFDWMTDVEQRFMTEHLQPRNPPTFRWAEQFKPEAEQRLIKLGTKTDLGVVAADLCRRRADFDAIAKIATAEKDALTEELARLIGQTESAVAGDWKIRWITRKAFSVAAREQPESIYLDIRQAKKKES